jgi:hypothetical protein
MAVDRSRGSTSLKSARGDSFDPIASAAQPGATHEEYLPLQERCESEGAVGKGGWAAEERQVPDAVLSGVAVGEDAYQLPAIEPVTQLQHGVELAEGEDVLACGGVDRCQYLVDLASVFGVHEHADRLRCMPVADGAENLEAAQVSAKQEDAAALGHMRFHMFKAVNLNVEEVEAAVQEVDAVVDGCGEGEDVAVTIGQTGRVSENALEIGPGGSSGLWGEEQEIDGDAVQYCAAELASQGE